MNKYNGSIVTKLMFASDALIILNKYIDNMDLYYQNLDNTYKDEKVYDYYKELKEELKRTAGKRGLK